VAVLLECAGLYLRLGMKRKHAFALYQAAQVYVELHHFAASHHLLYWAAPSFGLSKLQRRLLLLQAGRSTPQAGMPRSGTSQSVSTTTAAAAARSKSQTIISAAVTSSTASEHTAPSTSDDNTAPAVTVVPDIPLSSEHLHVTDHVLTAEHSSTSTVNAGGAVSGGTQAVSHSTAVNVTLRPSVSSRTLDPDLEAILLDVSGATALQSYAHLQQHTSSSSVARLWERARCQPGRFVLHMIYDTIQPVLISLYHTDG